MGYSAGSAIGGVLQLKDQLKEDDVVVIILHDHGSRYVGKIYNDDWMRDRGFLEADFKVADLVRMKDAAPFISIESNESVREAMNIMKTNDISQMPVMSEGKIVGSINESQVLNFILENPVNNTDKAINQIMGKAFPIVDSQLPARDLGKYISKDTPAVITKSNTGEFHIVTQYYLIQVL